MNGLAQGVWTYELTAPSITIDESFRLVILSITLNSGTGTIQGNLKRGGINSTTIPLTIGQPVTISSDGINPLDNYVITTTGSVSLIGK